MDSNNGQEMLERIKDLVQRDGIPLCAGADLSAAESNWFDEVTMLGLNYSISLGYRLSDPIIDSIIDRPNRDYLHHYRQINLLLDQASLKVTALIQAEGYRALPIPASQITDWKRISGSISHKLAAYYAGLVWIGRSSLAVNPDYGARVRYVTIATDLPLPKVRPLQYGCEGCMKCVFICPCGAIKEDSHQYDREACLEQLRAFAKSENLGTHYICGLCVKVCSGKKTK